jgi:uncharacterized membrane protein YphA (DoxX/SURF4 family)
MNTTLWILQIVLAVSFAGAGLVKLIKSPAELAKMLGGWVDDFPTALLKPLGLVELAGAVGLVLPPLLGVLPILTPVAAVGLAIVMLGAVVTHARRSEYSNVAVNVVLCAMALVIAWGRFGPYAF